MRPPDSKARLTAEGHHMFTARVTPSVSTWCHLAITRVDTDTDVSLQTLRSESRTSTHFCYGIDLTARQVLTAEVVLTIPLE